MYSRSRGIRYSALLQLVFPPLWCQVYSVHSTPINRDRASSPTNLGSLPLRGSRFSFLSLGRPFPHTRTSSTHVLPSGNIFHHTAFPPLPLPWLVSRYFLCSFTSGSLPGISRSIRATFCSLLPLVTLYSDTLVHRPRTGSNSTDFPPSENAPPVVRVC